MQLMRAIKFEKREAVSKRIIFLVPLFSIVIGLLFAGFFIAVTGNNPFEVYAMMFEGAFGSAYGLSETVVIATPLILCALGVSLAFRMQLWNIGAEGQL